MINCPNCQKPIRDDARFCKHCGKKLTQPTASGQLPQTVITPTRPLDPLVGRTFAGKYEIRAKLGQGGMGTVYLAKRIEIDDTVAVKVLNSDLVTDPDAVARFRREAQAAARLKHPNAVTIHDFGQTEDGIVYLVMELLEGRTLRDELQGGGRFQLQRAVQVMKQVCEAVDAAHQQGVIHRDLTPDNIVLEQKHGKDFVKVVDFGIAKLRDPTPGSPQLTQKGFVVGKPHYMSPEQCEGKELDPRSDIYSLGIVLYEMLTGSVPFKGTTPTGIIVQHIRDNPPPIRDVCPDISEPVERVVMRALAKNPTYRQQSTRELAQQLEMAALGNQFDQTVVITRPPVAPPSRTPWLKIVAVAVVLLVAITGIGYGVWWYINNRTDHKDVSSVEVTPQTQSSVADSQVVSPPPPPNRPPAVTLAVIGGASRVPQGQVVSLSANATDPDGDPLRYTWQTLAGNIQDHGQMATLDTSSIPAGPVTVTVTVDDGRGLSNRDTKSFNVFVPVDPVDECQAEFRGRRFQSAINYCRQAVQSRPNDPTLNLYLGQSYFNTHDYGNAQHYLARALDLGESLSFPIQHHHAGFPSDSLCQGRITIARNQIRFQSSDNQNDGFSVPFSNLLELGIRGADAQLHTRIQKGQDKKNYNFYSLAAQMVPVSEGSSVLRVNCNNCRPYIEVIYGVINHARTGGP